jgi:hypothetical protein
LITGEATEFYLYDPDFSADSLKALSGLGDTMIVDSGEFNGDFERLAAIERGARSVLDLQWVGLGLWRDEIKDLFGRPMLTDYLGLLKSIEITTQTPEPGGRVAAGALLGAWIINRLGLTENLKLGAECFECSNERERTVQLLFRSVSGAGQPCLKEVLFKFEPLQIGTTSQDRFIRLRRGEALETIVDLHVSFRSARPFDDESHQGRIRRYFLIGESMANYTAASRLAEEFERLRRGVAKTR